MNRQQDRLWTPIANALDSYRRRLLGQRDATYEHIWRLIQLHEAIVVTLGSALASRLKSLWKDNEALADDLNLLKTAVTGLGQTQEESADSCLSGSIKAWIDLLFRFGLRDEANCGFCSGVNEYLAHTSEDTQLACYEPWRRIAPVPETYSRMGKRIHRIDAVNSLRNKLAHVPIPEKVLLDLHRGLRSEIMSMLTDSQEDWIEDPNEDIRTRTFLPPLCGRIERRDAYVTGSDFGSDSSAGDGIEYVWNSASSQVRWSASPFVCLDGELKVSLLFRSPGITEPRLEDCSGEYYRFAAEIEPVQLRQVPEDDLREWRPIVPTEGALNSPNCDAPPPPAPAARAQDTAAEQLSTLSVSSLRARAESCGREQEWSAALKYFDELASRPDNGASYNEVAKLWHGVALWRVAAHLDQVDEAREQNFEKARYLLQEATKHRDAFYQARAFYELSKALWYQWHRFKRSEDLRSAIDCAQNATRLYPEPKYVSWHVKVSSELDELRPEGAG